MPKSYLLLVMALLLWPDCFAQTIKNGKREGTWKIWLDKNSRATQHKDSAVYYREISFSEGRPVGLVRDFYLSGKVRWEGYLTSDQPEDVRNGRSTLYDESGNKIEEAQYNRLGRKISSTVFNKSLQLPPPGDTLTRLSTQGNFEFLRGNYLEALREFEAGLALAEKKFGAQHLYYAQFLNSVSLLYQTIGSYEKAEALGVKSLQLLKASPGENTINYANAASNVAVLYWYMGLDEKAEPLLLQAIRVYKEKNLVTSSNYSTMLLNLGTLYFKRGNFEVAKQLLNEVIQSPYGYNSYFYTAALNTLADLYVVEKKNNEAERLILKALQLDKQMRGDTSMRYGESLMNLSVFYRTIGRYASAKQNLILAARIIKKQLGENHPLYGNILLQFGDLDFSMDDPGNAEKVQLQARDILKSTLGENNPNFTRSLHGLASTYWRQGRLENAESLFVAVNKNLLNQINRSFPTLSDKEKEDFYKTLKDNFELFYSFSLMRHAANPGISGEMFNVQLATKALLLNSSAKWKQRIRLSGDKKLASLYYSWEDQQATLAKLYKETDPGKRKSIDSLEKISNSIEKELSQRSENFANFTDKKKYTWQDVQQKLKEGEAAVEMIRLRKYGISKVVTDSSDAALPRYPKHDLTDTVYYAALIVTASSKHPALIVLKNGNELERRQLRYYRNSITALQEDAFSYDKFWAPIGAALGKKIKKIYFSPDGVYNSINLNTLFSPKTKKYLLEEIDIQLLTSSKDLVMVRKEEEYNTLAYLFGSPNFQTTKEQRATLVEKERSAQPNYYTLNLERSDNLSELPGTKTEVENIGSLLSNKGWQPEVLIGDQALEETLKDAFKPRVLHIATHGYFRPDSLSSKQNPLLQSGLMLTGAGRTMAGDKDEKTEDGILTAYEAMNLNLDNTDLVVLSACETGLGEIRNGEGVYGLQRAFKVAGAKSIIMSLWKVNDDATQELITKFYQLWLGGSSKRDALKKAALDIRTKFPNPYYWGAFVMIGE